MKIGVIGSGGMGVCLATKFVERGHAVSITNSRGPSSLKSLASDIGAEAATVDEAIKGKEVIVVSIPQRNIPDLAKDLFSQLRGDVILIDTGNYYPSLRDGPIHALDQCGIDSLWVQEQLGFPVVKVFNSILATSINERGRSKDSYERLAMAVSGDDPKAKEVVFGMVEELGFDPVDLGDLNQSWKQQPGSSIYCRDLTFEELKKRSAAMGTVWDNMRDSILSRRAADEILMKSDYPAYLKHLHEGY